MGDPFDQLQFDNRFIRELPADPSRGRQSRQVMNACYSRVEATPVRAPKLVAHSREMSETLGLDIHAPGTLEALCGNALAQGMESYAMCYGGHQFGNWAGQLGDGRALGLGELVGTDGKHWELQLKGGGPTPYSRGSDGRAVLRSSVREFLCSEAMHHLGVPTTRALSLVTTGDEVVRDMFYDGNPQAEHGAIVCRVAPTFLRFGSYQIHAARGHLETLEILVRYTLRHHFPDIHARVDTGGLALDEAVLELFTEVALRTARMTAEWMRVGFVHGVMNTDNMSILGLTIDYGPYGWLEDFDPGWTPNTTDAQGRRYRYGAQPEVAAWNLAQLAMALSALRGEGDESRLAAFSPGMKAYWGTFDEAQRLAFRDKLGFDELVRGEGPDDPSGDLPLVNDLLALLPRAEVDMTLFYRALARRPELRGASPELKRKTVRDAMYSPTELKGELQRAWDDWFARYDARTQQDPLEPRERVRRMNAANPKYVLRNYLAQLAIDRANEGDDSLVSELLDTLRNPYDEQPSREEQFAAKRPEWARDRPGCSMLSCSS